MRAAQYVRMSTEHQKYSLEYQSAANLAYALERRHEIVRTYTDAGVSGLSMRRREGLRSLLSDVVSGAADFDLVLVYDVSRWGRFQDPDQAAHYEFLCREAGVRVEYTAEPFDNDGSITSTIVKQIKRAMAAEYSRELSVKVATAQRGLSLKGYWRGAPCPIGFRRCELASDGSFRRVMEKGERKAQQGHRVVLVLGPAGEVALIRRIFSEYVVHGLSTITIARGLNKEGSRTSRGDLWTRRSVRRVLCDEKYVGTLVVGRLRSHLRTVVQTAEDSWVRVPGACPAIVSDRMFAAAQRNITRQRGRLPSNEVLVEELRRLLARHGRLTSQIIKEAPDTHCPTVFQQRFGDLLVAYEAAGYQPTRQQRAASDWMGRKPGRPAHLAGPEYDDAEIVRELKLLYQREGRISCALIENAENLPSSSVCRDRLGGMGVIYELLDYTPTTRQLQRLRPSSGSCSRTPAPTPSGEPG